MKRTARVIALILSSLLLFMLCPAYTEARGSVTGTGPSAILSAPAGTGKLQNTGIMDVCVQGSTVTVEYYTEAETTLYVQVLTDDNGNAGSVLSQKTAAVSATGSKGAKKRVEMPDMPEYFVIRTWLSDGTRSSQVFDTYYYTEVIQTLATSKPGDSGAPDRTVELWGSGDTGAYVVLPEGGHILSTENGYSLSPSDDGVTFMIESSAEDAFNGVEVGDVLCFIDTDGRSYRKTAFDGYNSKGEPVDVDRYYDYQFLKVKSVRVSGSRMTITSNIDEITDSDELFETVCLRGGTSAANKIDKSGEFTFSRPINAGISGRFTVSGSLTITISYEIYVTRSTRSIQIGIDYSFDDVTVSLQTSFNVSVSLFDLDFPIVPPCIVNLGIGISLSLDVSAEGDFIFQFYGKIGFAIENEHGYDQSTKPKFEYDATDLKGDVYVSIGIGPELNIVKILMVGYSVNFGVNFHVVLGGDEGGTPNKETWHACKPLDCLGLNITFKISMGFYLKLVVKTLNFPVKSWDWPIEDFYHSFTFGDGGKGNCPHIGYRTKVTAVYRGSEVRTLSDVDVSYSQVPEHYTGKSTDKTDGSGSAYLFIPNGTYVITAERTLPDGHKQTVTESVTVADASQALNVYFDDTKYSIRFHENVSGTVRNMPEDIPNVYADASYTLPSNVPNVAGRTFLGWAETADGEVKYYPGDLIPVSGDVDLFAVWRNGAGRSWTLVFHPNGGTDAPLAITEDLDNPILIPEGEPLRDGYAFTGWSRTAAGPADPGLVPNSEVYCTDETYTYVILFAVWDPVLTLDANAGGSAAGLPENVQSWSTDMEPGTPYALCFDMQASGRTFLGWAKTPDATVPDYVKDAVILMPDEPLTLYGVWSTDPMGYFVFYNANGGTGAPVVTVGILGQNVFLSPQRPEKDGYIFYGWAKTPDTDSPDYLPGDQYTEQETVTLYAVWGPKPVIACRITFDLAGGSGTIEDQYFNAGSEFRLTDRVPSQPAHIFLYWEYSIGDLPRRARPGDKLILSCDTVFTAVWVPDYHFTSGLGATYTPGSKQGLTFVCNGAFERFEWLGIDGGIVPEEDYTVRSGSTVLTLDPSFLDTMEEGEHSIVFIYDDGQTELGTFYVKALPPTGDASHPGLYAALAVISLCAVIFLLGKKKPENI